MWRITYGKLVVLTYAILITPISIMSVGKFFVDSQTYLSGYNSAFMSIQVALYPTSWILIVIVNLHFLLKLSKKMTKSECLFLLNPYNFLLLTNLTKEAFLFPIILFISYFSASVKFRTRLFGLLIVPLFLIRDTHIFPIAAILNYLSSTRIYFLLRILAFFAISIFGVVFFDVWSNSLISVIDLLMARGEGGHTGRDYFNYVCYEAKGDVLAFTFCWLSFKLSLPFHEDTLSINFLLLLLFNLSFYSVIHAILKVFPTQKAVFFLFVLLSSDFITFLWGPTAGAYQRYMFPIYSLIFFYALFSRFTLQNSRPLSSKK